MITADDLVGTWQLQSWTIGYSNSDKLSNPFGEDPEGLILYSPDGWMSASINRSGRKCFPEGASPRTISDAAKGEAFASYFHYAGPYRVVDGDVIHYVSQSLNPNFPGSEQLRHAELDGHTLVLSGKDQVGEVTRYHSLVWHRAPASEVRAEAIDSQ